MTVVGRQTDGCKPMMETKERPTMWDLAGYGGELAFYSTNKWNPIQKTTQTDLYFEKHLC